MPIFQKPKIERTDEEEVWEAESISELTRKQIETECRRFGVNPKGARKQLNSRVRDLYDSKDRYFTKECQKRRLEVSGTPFEKRRRLNRYGYLGLSALSDDNIADMLRRRNLKLDSRMKRKDMINRVLLYESEVYGKQYKLPVFATPDHLTADDIFHAGYESSPTPENPSKPASIEHPKIAEMPEDPEVSEIPRKTADLLPSKALLVKLEGELASMSELKVLGLSFHQRCIKNDKNSFWRLCARAMTPEEYWRDVRANTKQIWDLAVQDFCPPNRVKELRGQHYKSIEKNLTTEGPSNERRSLGYQFGNDGVRNPDQMFQIVLDAYGIEIFIHCPIFSKAAESISDARWLYRVLGREQTEARNQIHVVHYESLGQWTVLHRVEKPRPRAIKVIAQHDRYKEQQPSDPTYVRYGYRSPAPKPLPRLKGASRGQDYEVFSGDEVKKTMSDAFAAADTISNALSDANQSMSNAFSAANRGMSAANSLTDAFSFDPGPSKWRF